MPKQTFYLLEKDEKYLVSLKSVNGLLIDFFPLNENWIEEYPFEESVLCSPEVANVFVLISDQLFAATFDFLWLQRGVSSIGKLEESYIMANAI